MRKLARVFIFLTLILSILTAIEKCIKLILDVSSIFYNIEWREKKEVTREMTKDQNKEFKGRDTSYFPISVKFQQENYRIKEDCTKNSLVTSRETLFIPYITDRAFLQYLTKTANNKEIDVEPIYSFNPEREKIILYNNQNQIIEVYFQCPKQDRKITEWDRVENILNFIRHIEVVSKETTVQTNTIIFICE